MPSLRDEARVAAGNAILVGIPGSGQRAADAVLDVVARYVEQYPDGAVDLAEVVSVEEGEPFIYVRDFAALLRGQSSAG